jgi:ribosomal protein S18 acetylase RimI-like enzyme
MPKKYSGLNVSITKKKAKRKLMSRVMKDDVLKGKKTSEKIVSVRKLKGLKKELEQVTYFNPAKRELVVEIQDGEKSVGYLRALIMGGELKIAIINWKQVDRDFEKQGLATQMLAETLNVLEKSGVHFVKAQVLQGIGIYRKLGFKEEHRFGETWVWKTLNETK